MSNLPVKHEGNQDQTSTNIVVETKAGVWKSMKPWQRTAITSLAIFTGASLVGAIGFYFFQRRLRKIRYDAVNQGAFGGDKHDTWAKQLQLAFMNDGYWGTDVPAVRRTIREIPSREAFQKVQKSYAGLTKGGNLVADLADELTTYEYEEMLAIIKAKPQSYSGNGKPKVYDPEGWARRIHAALNYQWVGLFWGTDLDAIKAVFTEMPSQQAFWNAHWYYKRDYHQGLPAALDGDLSWEWDWRAALYKKPKKNPTSHGTTTKK